MVDIFLAVLGALSASMGPVLTKEILATLPPFQTIFLLSFPAFLTTLIPSLFFGFKSISIKKSAMFRALLIIGFLYQSLPACLTQIALVEVPSMVVVMLKRLQPLIIVFLLLLFRDHRFRRMDVVAALISVAGVYFLLNFDGWALQVSQFLNPPVLLIVVSVVLWALMFIKTESITRGIPAVFISCVTTGCLSLTSLPLALAEGSWNFEKIDASLGILILINGPLFFGLGLWAIFRSLKIFHPLFMSLIMLLGPVAALLVSTQLFGEELRGGQILGVFLIIGGLLCKILSSEPMPKSKRYTRLQVHDQN